MIRRREFMAALGGAAAWPLAARAQQGDRVRRIGVLLSDDENDPVMKPRVSAFTQALAGLGWTDGRNVRIVPRRTGGDINRSRALAQELVGLQPDIVLADSTPATVALQRETRTIPIVFAALRDPLAGGTVARLNRPGGNITGFANYEPTLGGKWLELLSEIAPGQRRSPPPKLCQSSAEVEPRAADAGPPRVHRSAYDPAPVPDRVPPFVSQRKHCGRGQAGKHRRGRRDFAHASI